MIIGQENLYSKFSKKSCTPPYENIFAIRVLRFWKFFYRDVALDQIQIFLGLVWVENELQVRNVRLKVVVIFIWEAKKLDFLSGNQD